MLKQMTLAAFALCSVAAFAQDDWTSIDVNSAGSSDLKMFVLKQAHRTMNAGDVYTLSRFLNRVPSNVENALLKGLANNALQSKMLREEYQTWANTQPPIGDKWTDMKYTWPDTPVAMDDTRPMRMFVMNTNRDLNYMDTLNILGSGLTVIEQNLISSSFPVRAFTESQIPTVSNEAAMDALTKYVQGNAKWTEPYRLKYTSFAPRAMYVSPIPSNWNM